MNKKDIKEKIEMVYGNFEFTTIHELNHFKTAVGEIIKESFKGINNFSDTVIGQECLLYSTYKLLLGIEKVYDKNQSEYSQSLLNILNESVSAGVDYSKDFEYFKENVNYSKLDKLLNNIDDLFYQIEKTEIEKDKNEYIAKLGSNITNNNKKENEEMEIKELNWKEKMNKAYRLLEEIDTMQKLHALDNALDEIYILTDEKENKTAKYYAIFLLIKAIRKYESNNISAPKSIKQFIESMNSMNINFDSFEEFIDKVGEQKLFKIIKMIFDILLEDKQKMFEIFTKDVNEVKEDVAKKLLESISDSDDENMKTLSVAINAMETDEEILETGKKILIEVMKAASEFTMVNMPNGINDIDILSILIKNKQVQFINDLIDKGNELINQDKIKITEEEKNELVRKNVSLDPNDFANKVLFNRIIEILVNTKDQDLKPLHTVFINATDEDKEEIIFDLAYEIIQKRKYYDAYWNTRITESTVLKDLIKCENVVIKKYMERGKKIMKKIEMNKAYGEKVAEINERAIKIKKNSLYGENCCNNECKRKCFPERKATIITHDSLKENIIQKIKKTDDPELQGIRFMLNNPYTDIDYKEDIDIIFKSISDYSRSNKMDNLIDVLKNLIKTDLKISLLSNYGFRRILMCKQNGLKYKGDKVVEKLFNEPADENNNIKSKPMLKSFNDNNIEMDENDDNYERLVIDITNLHKELYESRHLIADKGNGIYEYFSRLIAIIEEYGKDIRIENLIDFIMHAAYVNTNILVSDRSASMTIENSVKSIIIIVYQYMKKNHIDTDDVPIDTILNNNNMFGILECTAKSLHTLILMSTPDILCVKRVAREILF